MKNRIFHYRYEPFGGILHLSRPSALVWVDKDYMRSLNYPDSPLWDEKTDLLSAPVEVHASVTGQCSAGCTHCYVDSYKPGTRPDLEAAELGFSGNKKIVDSLAEAKVFHIALGGGESMEMPWFFDLAGYAVSKKIVPNLTTNGFQLNENNVQQCTLFGQINVSLDGVEFDYKDTRGIEGFLAADRALTLLKKTGCSFGINTVVSSRNFNNLEQVIRYAKQKKANQVELLRFKPAGRAVDEFFEMDLDPDQAKAFYPLVKKLTKKYRMNIRLDCSFMPMVFYHRPDPRRASFFSVAGCFGGDQLMGIRPDGAVNACSFAPTENWDANQVSNWWKRSDAFAPFRDWDKEPPTPCDVCEYLPLCRGGCHVVALAVKGSLNKPDPGCPIVREYTLKLH